MSSDANKHLYDEIMRALEKSMSVFVRFQQADMTPSEFSDFKGEVSRAALHVKKILNTKGESLSEGESIMKANAGWFHEQLDLKFEIMRALEKSMSVFVRIEQADMTPSDFSKLKGDVSRVAVQVRKILKMKGAESLLEDESRMKTNAMFFHELLELKKWIDGSSIKYSSGKYFFE